MISLIQRVSRASVAIDGEVVGRTERGVCVLLGVKCGDTEAIAQKLAEKTAQLRIFEDENGKMNRSMLDIGGGALVISQFTLCADCSGGRRPSFIEAAKPDEARALYQLYADALRKLGITVEQGVFGADMDVEIHNDGPVTIILDSDDLFGGDVK